MDSIQKIEVGDWTVSPARNLLERDGQSVKLKPRAMDVLVYLADHAGEVVSTEELISAVWQGRVVGDGTIYQSINQLRQALGDGTRKTGYIETIAKRGYRLVAVVRPAESPSPEARRKPIQSLVVLPLTNLSSDTEQDYFADGMTEVLIANLAKIRALKIISRTSAMRYKGSNRSLPEIAAELDVDAVVEGSVLRAGPKVRITLQLIQAATDIHIWGENYERDVEDVLLLQSEVAQAVTREIEIAVTPEEEKNLASARRVNPLAYEAYLKGRFHYWKVTPQDFEKALEYYNLALERDPDYALAYTGICDVWGARGSFGIVAPREAFSIGKPAALKAVEMDNQLAEAHEMIARYKMLYEWDGPAAERAARRAIALSPNNPDVGFAYWWFLLITRRFADAIKHSEHVLSLDPFNLTFQCYLGWQLLYERRHDDAVAQFSKVLAVEPNFPWARLGLGSTFHRIGMYEQALAEAKQYLLLMGHHEGAEAMEHGHADSGYQAGMLEAAKTLVAESKSRYVQAIHIARLYMYAGEKDLALDWLESSYEFGDCWLAMLHLDVDWDSVCEEPRFTKLLEKIGLDS